MNIPFSSALRGTVWEYCAGTSEVFLHYDTMAPDLCGRWMPFDAIDRQYQETCVFQQDLEIWRYYLAKEALRRFCSGPQENACFYIRFNDSCKRPVWHEICLQKEGGSRLFLQIRKAPEIQRALAIIKAAAPELDCLYRINLNDGTYVRYQDSPEGTAILQNAVGNYEQSVEAASRLLIAAMEPEPPAGQMRLERVMKELAQHGEYILHASVRDKAGLSHKKLRFCYEDEEHGYLLLAQTAVCASLEKTVPGAQEQAKRLGYLDNMPVAFCSIKVLLDKDGNPFDFQFTYCNRAHEKLENTEAGELLGKNFYEFFEDTDPKWLKYYYETAYLGIPHVIRSYSPEIQKYLLIYTFRQEYGHCECVLLDESEQHFLIQELEHSRETMKHILKITTALVFQYLPERDKVILDSQETDEQQVFSGHAIYRILSEKELMPPDSLEALKEGTLKIKKGDHSLSIMVQGRPDREAPWEWFRIIMFDFHNKYTHERTLLGFFQNIDEFRAREEKLRKKAELDSLTGLLNAGTGKKRITKMLERRLDGEPSCHIMFLTDLDNFKTINDTYGHMAGDKALVDFSGVLRRTFRAEDVIYRLGGDEFVVFVEKSPDAEQSVHAMLHRLMDRVKEAESESPLLACSVGAFVTNRRHTFEECYQMADKALYEAKKRGKGRFHIELDV